MFPHARRLATSLVASLLAALVLGVSAGASPEVKTVIETNISASVLGSPPKVQSAGRTYRMRIRVTNRGVTFRPLCVDFTDDKNSWLIEAPGLRSFDSDAFCAGTILRGQTKTLTFYVIAAKQGAHRMTVTIGKASVFKELNDIVIDDPGALAWEGNFVIV